MRKTHIDEIIPDDYEGKKLYHYTSTEGLKGMLLGEKIWCTHIFYLNDQEEFINGWKLFFELLNSPANSDLKQRIPSNSNFNEFEDFINSQKGNQIDFSKLSLEKFPYFVFSLSTKGDDLSQWRGYCPDNAGFNIEFVFNDKFFQKQEVFNTNKHFDPENESVILLKPCKYNNDEKKELLQSLFSWFRESDEKDADIELFFSILSLSVFFKDESFNQEDEYRLLVILDKSNNELMQFRQGKSTLINRVIKYYRDYYWSYTFTSTFEKRCKNAYQQNQYE